MTAYETPEQKQRIAVLDGLRALAIMMVMLRHAVRAFWPDMTQPFMPIGPTDMGYFFINGWIGVDLFFVLSGFLITSQLLGSYSRSADGRMNIGLYAKRRFFRIAPVYYFVLILTVLSLFPYFPYPESDENLGWRFFYHLFFMQDYFPSDLNVVFWTLAVEIKFYLLAPFILMGLLRLPHGVRRYAVLAAAFSTIMLARYTTVEYMLEPKSDYLSYFLELRSIFHLSLDGLLVGMVCGLLLRDDVFKARLDKPLMANGLFVSGVVTIALSMLSGVMLDLGVSFYDKVFQGAVIALGFGLMLLGLMGGCIGASLFSARPLYYIALLSYSMYLLHLPLFFLSEVILRQFMNTGGVPVQIQFMIFFAFAFCVVSFFSALSYFYIEKPFIRWSHKKKS